MKALPGYRREPFLPMNLPLHHDPGNGAPMQPALSSPGFSTPIHFGDTDTSKLTALLEDQKGIEVRIRRMP